MRSKFLKSNKLNPYDDKTEIEPSSRNTSWAITDHQSSFKIYIKKNLKKIKSKFKNF